MTRTFDAAQGKVPRVETRACLVREGLLPGLVKIPAMPANLTGVGF